MNHKRKTFWRALSIIATLFVLAVAGCQPLKQRQQARLDASQASTEVSTAFVGNLAAEASASGQLRPEQEATLALTSNGTVAQVYVGIGDQVRVGDVLVRLESGNLERAVQSAEQDLAIQEANLAELRQGARAEDVAAAQEAVANAQAQLDDLLAGPSAEELARAEAAMNSAQAQLADLEAGPSTEELAQARARLASAQASLQATKVRTEALDDQLFVAQNDIDNAQLAKDRARDAYDQLVWNDWKAGVSWGPYSPQGTAVKKAAASYDAAVANLNLTRLQISDSSLLQAQYQVAQAQAALAALTEERTVQIAAAQSQLARAEASLARLLEDKTVQIASARAQLKQAEANLGKLLDGASDEQLAIAEAQVEQARIALEEAQDNLDNATLTAPFDGLVTDVYVAEGELANGPAVELVNIKSLQVVLDVDEIDISHIALGQPAIITLEPWPDQKLTGHVVSIAPKAKDIGEIVTFEVQLDLDAEGLPILTGMTANAELTAQGRTDVLLVPNRAVIADRQENKYYVNRVDGESLTKTEVTIGLRDSRYTEITSGLTEGDQVSTRETEEPGIDFGQGPPEEVRESAGGPGGHP
jgi:HlyD family secretion protein